MLRCRLQPAQLYSIPNYVKFSYFMHSFHFWLGCKLIFFQCCVSAKVFNFSQTSIANNSLFSIHVNAIINLIIMIQAFRKMFQRVPKNQYTKIISTLKDRISNEADATSQIVSQEVEQYKNFNKELYRQHRETHQEDYLRRINRDFDANTVLRSEYTAPTTYYGSSLALFLLFDWQLLVGTSTYLTMLATIGGAGALFYKSACNSSIHSQITEIKLLENDQLQIFLHNEQSKRVALSDFKFNVKDSENDSFYGSGVGGYLVQAGKDYYRVNDDVRFNRSLFEKVIR